MRLAPQKTEDAILFNHRTELESASQDPDALLDRAQLKRFENMEKPVTIGNGHSSLIGDFSPGLLPASPLPNLHVETVSAANWHLHQDVCDER